ncbi:MAG TPA: hypothetical protein VJN62_09305 [Gemmatimonadales bacterium]|nr:hypothetical protein [Gemmatimonadales bacterium]
MSAQPLHDWQNFYLLIGGASATLVGLMFVAISLGAGLFTNRAIPGLRTFVSPTLIHFVYVLVTASVVLIPTVTQMLLGGLLVLVGLVSFGVTLSRLPFLHGQYRKEEIDKTDWVWYFLVPSAGYLLYVGTGIGLLMGISQALNGLAVASILLLVTGIRNAWDLVVRMVLSKNDIPANQRGGEQLGQGDSRATAERQVDPVAAPPPKEPNERPASRALPPSHQADVARAIQEAGLNPSTFTWALQPNRHALIGPLISALVHTPTGCFFRFEFTDDAHGQNRVSVFVPGKGSPELTQGAGSWEEQLGHIRTWLKSLSDVRR